MRSENAVVARFARRFSGSFVRSSGGFAAVGVVALLLAVGTAAAGPIGWGVAGGRYGGDLDSYFGQGGLYFSAGTITIHPNAEYIFTDNSKTWDFNADARLTILPLVAASGWLGAGVGRLNVDPDIGEKSHDTTVNLLAGIGLNAVPFKPYLEAKYMLKNGNDPFGMMVGVRF